MALINQSSRDISMVDPNPWQTRQAEDPTHIEELAHDILANGLLQIPVGRNADDGERCQLAFGHSRLAAYKLLVDLGHDEYREFPVIIRTLTDEEMAIMAFAENEKRRGLNPVERAVSIERMMIDFHWTQEQIAERLKLDRSSVSNAIRMLRLPQEILTLVAGELMPVRSAMALLPLYDLSTYEWDDLRYKFPDVDDFLALARGGQVNSDAIRCQVDDYMAAVRPEKSAEPADGTKAENEPEDLPLLNLAPTVVAEPENTTTAKSEDFADGNVVTSSTDDVSEPEVIRVDDEEETDEGEENPDDDVEEKTLTETAKKTDPEPIHLQPEPEPAATEVPRLTLTITWMPDGSANCGVLAAGSLPKFTYYPALTNEEELLTVIRDLNVLQR